ELLSRFLVAQAERGEDALLHRRVVQADGAARDLDAVEHEIVAVAEDLSGVLLDEVDAVVVGAGERVVRRDPAAFFTALEERRIDDPEELVLAARADFGDEPELLAEV